MGKHMIWKGPERRTPNSQRFAGAPTAGRALSGRCPRTLPREDTPAPPSRVSTPANERSGVKPPTLETCTKNTEFLKSLDQKAY